MKQSSSWQANGRSASQSILQLLEDQMIHYRVRNCTPMVPILSQINPVCTLTPYYIEIKFNIIFPPRRTFPSGFYIKLHSNLLRSDKKAVKPKITCTWHWELWHLFQIYSNMI
jgi:hypothetical protein